MAEAVLPEIDVMGIGLIPGASSSWPAGAAARGQVQISRLPIGHYLAGSMIDNRPNILFNLKRNSVLVHNGLSAENGEIEWRRDFYRNGTVDFTDAGVFMTFTCRNRCISLTLVLSQFKGVSRAICRSISLPVKVCSLNGVRQSM
jgi:hypothetical protein